MVEAGYRITIVGHSLGAGAASILALKYKQEGIQQVVCYAFATPNCVDLALAEQCAEEELVTSVVFRDDIVARFSPEAVAGLLQELKDFNLDQALQDVRLLAAFLSLSACAVCLKLSAYLPIKVKLFVLLKMNEFSDS